MADSLPYRRFLFAVVAVGGLGLLAELVLLEHYDRRTQFIPLALLALSAPAAAAALRRPSRRTLLLLRALMWLCVLAGAAGVLLHYQGNVEFELERTPELRGLALFWEAMRGATPTLASAALSQLGVLGLAAVFRHPVLSPPLSHRSAHGSNDRTHPSSGHDP